MGAVFKQETIRTAQRLPPGISERKPYPSEDAYFRQNKHVGGMAAEDNKVIINPHSSLTDKEKQWVAVNEAARIVMRTEKGYAPAFSLTPEQKRKFAQYGSEDDIKATIAARILTGDRSAGEATAEQRKFVDRLRTRVKPLAEVGPR